MVEKKIRQNLPFWSFTVISWHLRCIFKKVSATCSQVMKYATLSFSPFYFWSCGKNNERNVLVYTTQHCESDDTNAAPPSVWEVVDQALVGPSVGHLGVVDEDGGTCAWHGGNEAHTTDEVVGEAEDPTTLVNYHLDKVPEKNLN